MYFGKLPSRSYHQFVNISCRLEVKLMWLLEIIPDKIRCGVTPTIDKADIYDIGTLGNNLEGNIGKRAPLKRYLEWVLEDKNLPFGENGYFGDLQFRSEWYWGTIIWNVDKIIPPLSLCVSVEHIPLMRLESRHHGILHRTYILDHRFLKLKQRFSLTKMSVR
jgi:hypothetical protein